VFRSLTPLGFPFPSLHLALVWLALRPAVRDLEGGYLRRRLPTGSRLGTPERPATESHHSGCRDNRSGFGLPPRSPRHDVAGYSPAFTGDRLVALSGSGSPVPGTAVADRRELPWSGLAAGIASPASFRPPVGVTTTGGRSRRGTSSCEPVCAPVRPPLGDRAFASADFSPIAWPPIPEGTRRSG
jgi:hypothetical protein